jgi:hypothetical protein
MAERRFADGAPLSPSAPASKRAPPIHPDTAALFDQNTVQKWRGTGHATVGRRRDNLELSDSARFSLVLGRSHALV